MIREDAQLTANFRLFELTRAADPALQDLNRDLADDQMAKLLALAYHCENIRHLRGDRPMRVHSGYRTVAVNAATQGSSPTSQHPKCEAVDFDIPGEGPEDTFLALYGHAREGRLRFGQLIFEAAPRDYGVVQWIHCSLVGTLNPAHVGQVLRANWNKEEGKFDYELVAQLKFE